MTPHELLTEEETADFLRVCRRTLQYWRKSGSGPPFVKLGVRRIGYPRRALDSWTAERTQLKAAG